MSYRPVGVGYLIVFLSLTGMLQAGDESTRVYENRLKPIADARPILADFPQFVEPVREVARFEAPILIDDPAPIWPSVPGDSAITRAGSSRFPTDFVPIERP